jgi:hypothetical protein
MLTASGPGECVSKQGYGPKSDLFGPCCESDRAGARLSRQKLPPPSRTVLLSRATLIIPGSTKRMVSWTPAVCGEESFILIEVYSVGVDLSAANRDMQLSRPIYCALPS